MKLWAIWSLDLVTWLKVGRLDNKIIQGWETRLPWNNTFFTDILQWWALKGSPRLPTGTNKLSWLLLYGWPMRFLKTNVISKRLYVLWQLWCRSAVLNRGQYLTSNQVLFGNVWRHSNYHNWKPHYPCLIGRSQGCC